MQALQRGALGGVGHASDDVCKGRTVSELALDDIMRPGGLCLLHDRGAAPRR